jgi:hypothetical protein
MSQQPPEPPPGLSPDQLTAIHLAEWRFKKLARAQAAARIDGGITAFFAVACLLTFCMGWENLVLGAMFGAIAFNSFRGAQRLRRADPAAPAALAMNQVYLAGTVILYAVYQIYKSRNGSQELMSQLGDLKALGIDNAGLEQTYKWFAWIVYGGLIIGTILAQGAAAIYYATRKRYLDAYIHETPQWVVDFLKTRA